MEIYAFLTQFWLGKNDFQKNTFQTWSQSVFTVILKNNSYLGQPVLQGAPITFLNFQEPLTIHNEFLVQ